MLDGDELVKVLLLADCSVDGVSDLTHRVDAFLDELVLWVAWECVGQQCLQQ